jgi:predicted DNA-binding transcriptional regulator AlpA
MSHELKVDTRDPVPGCGGLSPKPWGSLRKSSSRRAPVNTEVLWTPAEVAAFLRIPVASLYQWRYQRKGPRAFRVGRHLRYESSEVRRWLEDQGRTES